MSKNNGKPNRQSIRLKGYDYSQNGLYFITICVQYHNCLLGKIVDNKMILNDAGIMIEKWYFELENKYKNAKCHEYIVMPNHFHCIIEIKNERESPYGHDNTKTHASIFDMMDWFKTMTTNEYIRGVKNKNWQRFNKRFWQLRYWDHIIRNDDDYIRISNYINNNPAKWNNDIFND